MSTVFQRLLLATEHTEFDTGAERLSMELARRCGLPLTAVLPLVSNPEFEAQAPEIAARAEHDAAAKIAQLRELARTHGVELDVRARRGQEPYQEIVDEARIRANDLIIIRRRGKRGFLANLLLGEMVTKVVAHAPCSALIVPRDAGMWQRRVLVAAEPTAAGQQIVARAAAVAAECGLPLSIVCVIPQEDPALRQQAEALIARLQALQPGGLSLQGQTLVGKPYLEILQAVKRETADLLVIGSRSEGIIKHALVGGVAQKAIGLSECPVLVVHFDHHPTQTTL
jgi:hypothetical protein